MLCVQPFVVDSHALAFQNPDGQPDKTRIRPCMTQDRSSLAFEPAQIAADSKTGRQSPSK
jgi:hypothetical protein